MNSPPSHQKQHLCIIVIGMSGTGKTTFVDKFSHHHKNIHCINLDPAVKILPYQPYIDIRKTHDYKKIMNQYKLGPNGAILTALNLYTAQPQIIVNAMAQQLNKYNEQCLFIIDIPGQIEVFTWSASSLILTQSISTIMPVKILYLLDTVRCINPNTFLSNLLFAQSIRYRFNKYQFLILLNKADVQNADNLIKMMRDYDVFLDQLAKQTNYMSTFSRSVVINMSDLFAKVKALKVSAKTGFGFQEVDHVLNIGE